jgi:hypothetical protein
MRSAARYRYMRTFFSLRTGHAHIKGYFLDHDEDRIKMFLHGINRRLWSSIRDDVKLYVRGGP